MRITRALPLMFAALAFAACGSSSTKKNPDAHVNLPDGSTTPDGGTPDAASAAVTGLGQACNPSGANTCPASAATCDALTQGATNGWCTPSCGQTAWVAPPGQPASPGAAGNTMCKNAYTGMVPGQGTPGCVIYSQDQTDMTKADWTCAILCGQYMTTNFGGCPGGLTCNTTDNLCE